MTRLNALRASRSPGASCAFLPVMLSHSSSRRDALASYQRELESTGAELTRITQTAYQEGEVGILELLDSLRVNRVASLRLLELQAGVKEAFIELERALGEEVRP